jgi:hypothetical protein
MHSVPASVAAREWLAAPDAVIPLDRPVEPLGLAVTAALGLAGCGSFAALLGAGMQLAGVGAAGGLAWWSLPAVPPLAALLTFPPLYLVTALQGRPAGSLVLAAAASSGPVAVGAWLGAASPLVLLYLLTGEIDGGFFLLCALSLCGAVAAGAAAAVRNTLRGGPAAPGALTILAHYGLTVFTVAVLCAHLVGGGR